MRHQLQQAARLTAACSAESGLTALHMAALKGGASALYSLLRHGAAADAQVMGNSITPWLAQGSTALHISAARGYVGCVTVLLEFQATVPGARPGLPASAPPPQRRQRAWHPCGCSRDQSACRASRAGQASQRPSRCAGMELRKVRNMRGLKPSQVARMGGHHGLARLLSDARPDRRRRPRGPQLSPDALLAVLVQVRGAVA